MERKMIKWGIIGCGNVTECKSGPAFYRLPDSSLTAVMRRDEAACADFARRHGVMNHYTDASLLIADPQVEAVYIATPPESHARYAIQAMMAGKPVYVEKPMALNFAQCKEMIRVSEQTGVPLFVAYYRRWMPYFLKVKELLDSALDGKLIQVELRLRRCASEADLCTEKPWRLDPSIAGGGYFVDMGSHQIDMLLFLFGPIAEVKSMVANRAGHYAVEDTVDALIRFESGLTANCSWAFCVAPDAQEDEIRVFAEGGTLRFSTFAFDPIVLQTPCSTQQFPIARDQVVEQPMIAHINDLLRHNSNDPDAMLQAAEVTRVIDLILRDYSDRT